MPGHVFIVRGDLRRLACDAWLIPCSLRARPGNEWFVSEYEGPRFGTPFVNGDSRVQPLGDMTPGRSTPWLCRIGSHDRPVSWYADGAVEFLEAASQALIESGASPLFGRAAYLLALPIIGTGKGGAADQAGEIVQELLPRLEAFATRTFPEGRVFDVALVCWDAAGHAAALAERDRRQSWPSNLTEGLRAEAERLARHALRGELALFLGAGVSMAAGLPSWSKLIEQLAIRAGMSDEERAAIGELRSVLDQATLVERRLKEHGEGLGSAVAAALGSHWQYGLTHALLASLPVKEVITTNYDRLFEDAWTRRDPNGISIIPGAIRPDAQRWLLKMHGCLSEPDRVVLTRSSYTRYDERLPGLAGMVQAFLVTRHVLFVGFSMTDDNFHRIIDAVRRLRDAGRPPGPLGTVLALGSGGVSEVLWEADVHRVRMTHAKENENAFAVATAARTLEIFLDYLVSLTRGAAHLLVGERFNSLLTPGEKILRDALANFMAAVGGEASESVRETVAWPRIEQLLKGLGFEPKAESSPPTNSQS